MNVTTATGGKEKYGNIYNRLREQNRGAPDTWTKPTTFRPSQARTDWRSWPPNWPAWRLVDVWNSFAAVVPFDDLKSVKKFTSRKAAVGRIWQAIQRLSRDVAQQAAPVATAKGKSKRASTKGKRRDTARKGANVERTNKKAEVIALMKLAKGATLAEIMEMTGWQKHTVRGFVSILAARAARKSNRRTTPPGSGRTASPSSPVSTATPFKRRSVHPAGGVPASAKR